MYFDNVLVPYWECPYCATRFPPFAWEPRSVSSGCHAQETIEPLFPGDGGLDPQAKIRETTVFVLSKMSVWVATQGQSEASTFDFKTLYAIGLNPACRSLPQYVAKKEERKGTETEEKEKENQGTGWNAALQ